MRVPFSEGNRTPDESEAAMATAHEWAPPEQSRVRVSDADRERVVSLLREQWLAGRLTLEELEHRAGRALAASDRGQLSATVGDLPIAGHAVLPAPPAPAPASGRLGTAVASLTLGILGVACLVMSLGFLSILTLPLSASAWGLGRSARRGTAEREAGRGIAVAGEALGVVGTVLSGVLLAGCAAVVLSW
jgi:hypothetical protein